MKVRVIYNSKFAQYIVKKNITLYPFIFMIYDEQVSRRDFILNHEWIHIIQIRKIGWLKFYTSYLWKYVKNLVKYRNPDVAYREVSYEKEAYMEQWTVKLPDKLE